MPLGGYNFLDIINIFLSFGVIFIFRWYCPLLFCCICRFRHWAGFCCPNFEIYSFLFGYFRWSCRIKSCVYILETVLILDRTLSYYTMFNVLRIVVVWWLVGFVCEPTTYYPLLKMFLPLSNIFYFVVIVGGPVINNFYL
jgi:hypothetical protein